jgi:hypothetical protein
MRLGGNVSRERIMGAISDFASGLIAPVAGLVSEFIEDKDKANELAFKLSTLAGDRHQSMMLAQVEINKLDAQSGNWFQAGWRPAVGWVCVIAMANNFIVLPYALAISENIVPMDWAAMSPVLLGMLGLATNRTVEKIKGKA